MKQTKVMYQKYTVEYTEKTFKETESAKDVIIPLAHPEILYL